MRIRSVDLTYPRVLLAGLLVATALTGGYAATTSNASFGSYNPGWDGSQSLRLLADSHADTTIGRDTAAYEDADAPNTTAILLSPDRQFGATDIARVDRFLDRGGTLVVAGDFGTETNQVLSELGVGSRIDGRLVRDERFYYRNPALPVAGNVSGPLANHTESLTLNYGTVVNASANATVLIQTSGFAYLDENGNAQLDDTETLRAHPVVVKESVGDGTVLVVSDPSVFINAMLDRDGNRAFATHLVAQHENVLLDYSHTADLPLSAVVLLVLGDSWILQVILGTTVLAVVGRLGESSRIVNQIRALAGKGDDSETLDSASDDALVAAVADRHPEWNEAHLQQVTQSIRTGTSEEEDDD